MGRMRRNMALASLAAAVAIGPWLAFLGCDPTTAPPAGADTAAEQPTVAIRVVDAATGAPVPGAVVRWMAADGNAQIARLPEPQRTELRSDAWAATTRFGEHTTSDAHGLALVPVPPQTWARHHECWVDTRHGRLMLRNGQSPPAGGWQLRVEPDLVLQVRVRDAGGALRSGVPVQVLAFDAGGRRLWHWDHWNSQPRWTGADGSVTYRGMQAWLRERQVGGNLPDATWYIALAVPGLEQALVPFDPRQLPSKPIELQVPATGALQLSVVHQGQRYRGAVHFQALVADDPWRNDIECMPAYSAAADGLATLAPVALGSELLVRASLGGEVELRRTVRTPAGAGDVLAVALDTRELIALRGHLLGPDGTPLARQSITIWHPRQRTQRIETAADGGFLWFLDKNQERSVPGQPLVFSWSRPMQPTQRARLDPRPLQRGVNDLGVITLTSGPLVVAGRIAAPTPPPDGSWPMVVEAFVAGDWQPVLGLSRNNLAGGRFEFRGETQPTRHRLRLPGSAHLPVVPIEFQPGTADVQIALDPGHRLTVVLRTPQPGFRSRLSARLRPHAERSKAHSRQEAEPAPSPHESSVWVEGRELVELEWAGLPPGIHALDLLVDGVAEPIATIPGLVVPQPGTGHPQPFPIDLRPLLPTVRLAIACSNRPGHAATPDEAPVIVFRQPQCDPGAWRGWETVHGALLPLPAGTTGLLVCRQGFEPVLATIDGATATAVLAPWPQTLLHLEVAPALPRGFELQLTAQARTVWERRTYTVAGLSGNLADLLGPGQCTAWLNHGKTTLELREVPYELSLSLVDTRPGVHGSVLLPELAPKALRRGSKPASLALTLPEGALAAAIAKLATNK